MKGHLLGGTPGPEMPSFPIQNPFSFLIRWHSLYKVFASEVSGWKMKKWSESELVEHRPHLPWPELCPPSSLAAGVWQRDKHKPGLSGLKVSDLSLRSVAETKWFFCHIRGFNHPYSYPVCVSELFVLTTNLPRPHSYPRRTTFLSPVLWTSSTGCSFVYLTISCMIIQLQ